MIVRRFLQWLRSAPASERTKAASILARAYLQSELSAEERGAIARAMLLLLDDSSSLVRAALAIGLASSPQAPLPIVRGLAADQPDIAAIILKTSPLLSEADLVDAAATGGPLAQQAIAGRKDLPPPVAAAIAEIGCAEACLVLIENIAALSPPSLTRIVERFGHLAAIRDAALIRSDIPVPIRHELVTKLSVALRDYVVARDWLPSARATDAAREACEKASVDLAGQTQQDEMRALVAHLRDSGQLTASLLLRALFAGHSALFEAALADLSGLGGARVRRLVKTGEGLRALYDKAGLPALAYPAFHGALATLRENASRDAAAQSRRIERVLKSCEENRESASLLALLRDFSVEAARDEARIFCAQRLAA